MKKRVRVKLAKKQAQAKTAAPSLQEAWDTFWTCLQNDPLGKEKSFCLFVSYAEVDASQGRINSADNSFVLISSKK